MKKTILTTIFTLLFLLSCELAPSDYRAEMNLITISLDYHNSTDVNNLHATLNDAKEFNKVICEICNRQEITLSPEEYYQEGEGIDNATIENPKYPTKPHVLTALEQLKDKSKDNSINIIYFSGHGLKVDGSWLLATTTGESLNPDGTVKNSQLLSPDEIYEKLEGIRGNTLIISDSCHSGFLYRENPYSLKEENFTLGEAFKKFFDSSSSLRYENIYFLSSVNHDKTAYEQGKGEVEENEKTHGYFTKALLEGLGWAKGNGTVLEDENIDLTNFPTMLNHGAPPASINGIVSVDSLYSYIIKNQEIYAGALEYQDPQVAGRRKDLILFRY